MRCGRARFLENWKDRKGSIFGREKENPFESAVFYHYNRNETHFQPFFANLRSFDTEMQDSMQNCKACIQREELLKGKFNLEKSNIRESACFSVNKKEGAVKKRKQSIAGETFLVSQRTSPPSATSIGAADRCRSHRLFRSTRGAPCALKAAPATGRPVVSLPPSKKAVWVRQKHAIYLCSAGKEKHASRRNPSFFVTGDVFFTAPPQCKHAFRISVLQKNCPCLRRNRPFS